jgi:hypothetical protein
VLRRFDNRTARRELQLASISDIQGSIQANDTKGSAALVVHGLLFAGVVTVAAGLGDVYDRATPGAKIAGALFLAVGACAFAVSVWRLIDAVEPHTPASDTTRWRFARAFFPPAEQSPGVDAHREQLRRLQRLTTEADLEREYAAEQMKLAEIRASQATAARRAFTLVRVELVMVALFLATVLLVALHVPVVSAQPDDLVSLEWTVAEGGQPTQRVAGGVVSARAVEAVTLTLVATGDGLDRIDLVGNAAWRCRGVGSSPPQSQALLADADGASRSDTWTATQVIGVPACRGGARPELWADVVGSADADDATARSSLHLRSR